MKIVFVILHYLAIDETYKSVDSIEKKIDTDMYKIVIVDNASPDKSGALLKEHYKNDDHVEVLLNQENLGFARGNNVGFRYAEKTWNPSYIVLMNNEVNTGAAIELQTTDSTTGMTSAIDGSYDIGMASRELQDDEKDKLDSQAIATDGIAVIVNKNNTTDELSSDQVKDIYTGNAVAWDEVVK